ncbi:MAG: 2-oxoacid:acceptor oxidoreductase subunit alpha [Candidatus Aenigmarchaeota archaeon]|nr:2-oxoacid:acceptor oxidoreductase subunit alpha [Candidatus Aenigmarchaeota archaeon]
MAQIVNSFSWKIAGAAGDGILSAGMLFAKMCMRGGLHVCATAEYPSLIRGGHNHLDVRVAERKVHAQSRHPDLLIALNQDAIEFHAFKVADNGGIIYDSDQVSITPDDLKGHHVHLFSVPLRTLAEEHGGTVMRNTIALGATLGLVDYDLEFLNQVLKTRFGKKGEEIIAANMRATQAGYNYVKEHYTGAFSYKLQPVPVKQRIMITGNEAISTGAIRAGCKFFSAYPMTPASSLLHFMAEQERAYNLVVKHTEDEIAAINMAIGASYAGARSMTSTSGGGFALMVEAFGLAAMTETPLVVVEAQRPGPATGMATQSGQADLKFMLNAGTDEFPRIVVAPGDVDECFFETFRAFNLAEKYQTPVIVLTDKYLGESYWSTNAFDSQSLSVERGAVLTEKDLASQKDYRRYAITESGVSPRVFPGQKNGMHVATSYEHDEKGREREEEQIRVAMHEKRFRKIKAMEQDIPAPTCIGPEHADVTLIGWGSTKAAILEALELLKKQNISANYVQMLYVAPFPTQVMKQLLSSGSILIDIENNKTGQLASLIKEQTGIDVNYKILKFDGRPFSPEDIAEAVCDIRDKKIEKIITIERYYKAPKTTDLDAVKIRTFKVVE